jgi:asparagine synthase (glutamine-hydrolysing)
LCGIAGTLDHRARTDRECDDVLQSLASLRHRGPDGVRARPVGQAALGHARLAIMDPAGGAQPLVDGDTGRGIVVNGEIYNWRELRARIGDGYRFATDSDSEVLLPLFDDVGPGMVEDLDGMFAFALADGDRLVLGRDPIGIKPIYVGRTESGWRFASEMKALAGRVRHLTSVPPGHVWDSTRGLTRFYQIPDPGPRNDVPAAEHRRRLRHAIVEAVEKRLMADVPIGAFLSGGLDSSIIAAVAARRIPHLPTFTVGVAGSPDLLAARQVAAHIGSEHHELAITPADVRDALPEIVYHLESFDRDVVRSAIPTWFVARLAARHVKTVLTGEGADELFAGYTYYRHLGTGRLRDELTDSIGRMHNVNLQRVDRMTMAHGLEARVPFLDTAVISHAQEVPTELKLRPKDGASVEKWILRSAFEDLLPSDVVWRDKAQFDEGSGTTGIVDQVATGDASPVPGAHHRVELRSAEEAFYHRLFTEAFADPAAMEPLVGRWIPDAA